MQIMTVKPVSNHTKIIFRPGAVMQPGLKKNVFNGRSILVLRRWGRS